MNEVTIEDVKQFIRDLQSYSYYCNRYRCCNNRLVELQTELYTISSIKYDQVIIENKQSSSTSRINYLLEEEEKTYNESQEYFKRVDYIYSVYCLIDKYVKKIIFDLYIDRKSHEQVARNNYISRTNMYRLINKEIKTALIILKKRTMS